jgi:hypothetical protein
MSLSAAEYQYAVRLSWSERVFTDTLIREATARGWMVAHFRPAKTDKGWRTAMQGDAGFPDLALARGGQTILAELKSEKGRVSAEQKLWLAASHGYLWRPSDWESILTTLD